MVPFTSLTKKTQDAAVVFDPTDVTMIDPKMYQLWKDEGHPHAPSKHGQTRCTIPLLSFCAHNCLRLRIPLPQGDNELLSAPGLR